MTKVPELADYHISPRCGFLVEDPLENLPEYFAPWETTAKNLITLFEERKLREVVNNMPLLDHTKLRGYRQIRLGYACLCFITNCYVWQDGDDGVVKSLPRQVAIPLSALAAYVGSKPALGHAALMSANWKKIDPNGSMDCSNIDFNIHLTKGPDFLNFMRPGYQVEVRAIPGIKACVKALKAVVADDIVSVTQSLGIIKQSLLDMTACFDMFKTVSPGYFFFSFGTLASGWGEESSNLPEGLIYEGVSSQPRKVFPANAGQSAVIYTLDATLGINHAKEALPHLDDVLMYMPYCHREFVLAIRRCPSLKDYVAMKNDSGLTGAYNQALSSVVEFRSAHIRVIARLLVVPSKNEAKIKEAKQVAVKSEDIPGAIGYLKNNRDDTSRHMFTSDA